MIMIGCLRQFNQSCALARTKSQMPSVTESYASNWLSHSTFPITRLSTHPRSISKQYFPIFVDQISNLAIDLIFWFLALDNNNDNHLPLPINHLKLSSMTTEWVRCQFLSLTKRSKCSIPNRNPITWHVLRCMRSRLMI
jgi:hypothetical protein